MDSRIKNTQNGDKPYSFNPDWENLPITTIPKVVRETGHYFIDFYGCWHEVVLIDGSHSHVIGEYPS